MRAVVVVVVVLAGGRKHAATERLATTARGCCTSPARREVQWGSALLTGPSAVGGEGKDRDKEIMNAGDRGTMPGTLDMRPPALEDRPLASGCPTLPTGTRPGSGAPRMEAAAPSWKEGTKQGTLHGTKALRPSPRPCSALLPPHCPRPASWACCIGCGCGCQGALSALPALR